MNNKDFEDDYCDLYGRKICDNCGKCLEEEGVDIKAIKIEDIAKKVEENELLEAEYKRSLTEDTNDKLEIDEIEEDNSEYEYTKFDLNEADELKKAYERISLESGLDFTSLSDDEYEDAFDHIEYIEEYDLFDEATMEEMTVEVFPGVRRLKGEN